MKNENILRVTIALGALFVGVAFGHWGTSSHSETSASAAPPAISANAGSADPALDSLPSDHASGKHANPSDLVRILKDRKNRNRLRELTDYIDKLTPDQFAAALLATRNLPRGADRDLATRLLASHWADLDPDSALAFATKHEEFDLTGDIFRELAANDISSALARAQTLSDPNMRYQALSGALSVMAETDPAGAIRLAGTLGDFPNNEPLSQLLYRQWSSTDPLAAATLAARDTSGSGWRSPLGQVIRTWAGQDPQGALSYAMTISDPASQAHSVGDIVRRWSEQDPGAAASWINTVPAGSIRDAAVAALASSVASTDLPAAVGWAQSISDEAARTAALQRVSRRVLRSDPTNGAATLESAGVPATLVQQLPPPQR